MQGVDILLFGQLHKLLSRGTNPTPIPVNNTIGNKFMYYKRRKEDENSFLISGKGGWFLSPY